MNGVIHFIIYNLDIIGILILLVTLVPIRKLMHELPPGLLRKRWKILTGMIFFFIGSYLYIALQNRIESLFFSNEVIFILLFFGASFVFLVSTLSLQTTLDIKRIYTLEIENITDPLMGISNRRHLERKLHEEFTKAIRYNLPFSILMIDIDHFKNVNDTYGHDAGDMVLKNLGTLIKKFIREFDCAARYGGEEIVIIAPLTEGKHAALMAERLRKEIQECVIVPADREKEITEIHVTVSIGIAEYTPKISSVEELVKRADSAMYRAKHEGRNRIFLCDGTTTETVVTMKDTSNLTLL